MDVPSARFVRQRTLGISNALQAYTKTTQTLSVSRKHIEADCYRREVLRGEQEYCPVPTTRISSFV